jgi:hypothetical protein
MTTRSVGCGQERNNEKIIIIKQQTRRASVRQTQIDNDSFNKRRRNAGPLFDQMKQILTIATGGQMKKCRILALAERIAQEKQLKLDRSTKRIKDCLICWFCEHLCDVMSVLLPTNNVTHEVSTTKMSDKESQHDPFDNLFMSDHSEVTWMMESDLL